MKKNKLTALSTLVFFLLQVSFCFADPVFFALPGPMAHMVKIASTDNWDVTLKISVTDAGSGMGAGAEMQFSNDNSNWSAAEAFAVSKAWKLASGSGAKTVYAKFKDALGNWSGSISDAINVAVVPKERIYVYLNGQRVAMEETSAGVSKKYFYHNDHLGSTSVVTDISGAQVKYLEYKPYGETKVEEGSLAVKKKFTGKELDDSTGLYDYAARMYDAKLTRFITPDTIDPKLTNPQSLNRYSYCLNNPLKYVDPTGHFELLPEEAGGGDIGLQRANSNDFSKLVSWRTGTSYVHAVMVIKVLKNSNGEITGVLVSEMMKKPQLRVITRERINPSDGKPNASFGETMSDYSFFRVTNNPKEAEKAALKGIHPENIKYTADTGGLIDMAIFKKDSTKLDDSKMLCTEYVNMLYDNKFGNSKVGAAIKPDDIYDYQKTIERPKK